MTFTSAFCSVQAIQCLLQWGFNIFGLPPLPIQWNITLTSPLSLLTAGHHTPSHAIPQISIYRMIPHSPYGSMQALYMIFWKMDSQFSPILVDKEPFSLSQVLHTSYTFVLLQHRRVSMAGTAWPASWSQREHGAGHLQEMGRSKLTQDGNQAWLLQAAHSLSWEGQILSAWQVS